MNPKRPACCPALPLCRSALIPINLLTLATSLGLAFAQPPPASAPPPIPSTTATPATTPPPTNASNIDDILSLSEFVVSGSVTPRSRFDSPVAITTIDRTTIEAVAPRNTAEFLKVMPGIYAESTGGEAFNNISVRGFGGTAGYSYEHLYEDGLPVYSTNNLRHGLPDAWTRISTFHFKRRGGSKRFVQRARIKRPACRH
jgi:outer membrane receptor protein involved in Fe transport